MSRSSIVFGVVVMEILGPVYGVFVVWVVFRGVVAACPVVSYDVSISRWRYGGRFYGGLDDVGKGGSLAPWST